MRYCSKVPLSASLPRLAAASVAGLPAGAWGAGLVWIGAADGAADASAPGAPGADSGCGTFTGSTGAVLFTAGAGVAADLVNAVRGAEADSGGAGSAGLGWEGARGAAAKGASLAVSTSSVFAAGAGARLEDMPSNTSACSAIETSTHQNKTRFSASDWMSPAVVFDADMGQG